MHGNGWGLFADWYKLQDSIAVTDSKCPASSSSRIKRREMESEKSQAREAH